MNRPLIWKICCISVSVITILTFTPLISPKGISGPFFMGMPYTLWVGILVTLILLALTVLGSFVHPGRREELPK